MRWDPVVCTGVFICLTTESLKALDTIGEYLMLSHFSQPQHVLGSWLGHSSFRIED